MLGNRFYVRVQSPIILDDWSELEPDLAICTPDLDQYRKDHPRAHPVQLMIEVADTSLSHDRGQKAAAYAASKIASYWVVNLVDELVEAHSDPDPAGRRCLRTQLARPGDNLPPPSGVDIPVSEMLGLSP